MTLRFNGSSSGYVEIAAPASPTNNTLTLPTGNGTSGQYLQSDGTGALSWQDVTTVNGLAYPSAGPLSNRNKIINGNFDVWQRGTSLTFSASGPYLADRWAVGGGTSTTVSRQGFTPGQTDVPGEPIYFLRWDITNNSQNYEASQKIEDVRTFAGQQATLSFYARRTSGTVSFNARIVQDFGTGGSPSSLVVTSLGTPSLTTSWQKFTYTVSVPSISGKTLGTDGNSSLWTSFQIGNTGTGVIELAQVQFEAGSVATPFEHRSYGDELLRCQRYFVKIGANYCGFRGTSTTSMQLYAPTPVEMRTTGSVQNYTSGSCRKYDSSGITHASSTLTVNAIRGAMVELNGTGFSGVGDNQTGFLNFTAELEAEL